MRTQAGIGLDAPGPQRPPGRRRRRWPLVVVVVAVVLAVLAVVAVSWVRDQVDPGHRGAPVALTVPAGSSLSAMAGPLARRGVIGDQDLFRLWLRFHHVGDIRPGYYTMHRSEPYSAVVAQLEKGPQRARLTIPEGFTLARMAARVGELKGRSSKGFLAAASQVRSSYEPPEVHSLEGLLFPATYLVSPGESDRQILQQMVSSFDGAAASSHLRELAPGVGLSPYQVVTVASMVEREAKLPADRGKVARVIYNRLAKGMKLQVDATVLYALGNRTTSLSSSDLQVDSPYNTYVHYGLPPTPIASPGVASLEAALHPTPGPWLYYVVVSKDGAEAFSTTLAAQQRNIALARSRGLG
ncbi:MAG: endolytic transglycosylase MltG [Acidimicrobiales bacterium]